MRSKNKVTEATTEVVDSRYSSSRVQLDEAQLLMEKRKLRMSTFIHDSNLNFNILPNTYMTPIMIDAPLNEQQLMMLRLFKKPLPEADFQELRKLVIKLLSKRLDETVEAWDAEKEIDGVYYEELSKGHFRKSKQ